MPFIKRKKRDKYLLEWDKENKDIRCIERILVDSIGIGKVERKLNNWIKNKNSGR